MLLPYRLWLLSLLCVINLIILLPTTHSQSSSTLDPDATASPTTLPTESPTDVGCEYYDITQPCCGGGNFTLNETNFEPICNDGNDVCGSNVLIGNASILNSNAAVNFMDGSCSCSYSLEVCQPRRSIFEDTCNDARVWECCALVAPGELKLNCSGLNNNNYNECEETLTYECARGNDDICNYDDIAENIERESYWSDNEPKYTPYLYWWYDNMNRTLSGSCYCGYQFFIQSCPTPAPTVNPTTIPTMLPIVNTTEPRPDFEAEFQALFKIHMKNSTDASCDDENYWTIVFTQILENTYSINAICNVTSKTKVEILLTAEWDRLKDYGKDDAAKRRVEDNPLDEIEEYGPVGMISIEIEVRYFICPLCYKLSIGNTISPNFVLISTLIGSIIYIINHL